MLEEPIRDLGVEVFTFPRHQYSWEIPLAIIQSLFTNRPYPLPKNFSPAILSAINCEIRRSNVAAIHFNHLDAAQYIELLDLSESKIRVIFDTHNILSTLYAKLVAVESNYFRKVYCELQERKMQVYERQTMRKVDCVIVCSEAERWIVNEWNINNCVVAPNGVDTKFFTPRKAASSNGKSLHLVFSGAMDYRPNADGIRWFLRSVLPELERMTKEYKITIVGKDPPSDLLELRREGKIEFTCRVDDVRPYMCLADIFVVPLKVGGGTRLKILEALAMELPVVSTALGAEGLTLKDGAHIRIADSASAMARIIGELSARPDYAQEMARRGRGHVLKWYDWDRVTVPIGECYENFFTRS